MIVEIESATNPVNQFLFLCCVNAFHMYPAVRTEISHGIDTTDREGGKNDDDPAWIVYY